MKILILTPLFPPDTAPSARYTKELAERLGEKHDVTVLLYGHLPENVPGVTLVSIDKRRSAFARAKSFIGKLQRLAREQDVILIQNGPSVELPSLLALRFAKAQIILTESDAPALKRTLKNPFLNAVYYLLENRARVVFKTDTTLWPNERPVIHPLKPKPDMEIKIWNKSWNDHLDKLASHFNQT